MLGSVDISHMQFFTGHINMLCDTFKATVSFISSSVVLTKKSCRSLGKNGSYKSYKSYAVGKFLVSLNVFRKYIQGVREKIVTNFGNRNLSSK